MALSCLWETSVDCLQYDLHTILKYSNFLLMLNTICRNHYVISIKYYSLFTSLSRVYQLLFLHFPPFYIEKAYYYLFLCCPKIFTKDGIGKSKMLFIKDCATPKRNRQRKKISTRNIPPRYLLQQTKKKPNRKNAERLCFPIRLCRLADACYIRVLLPWRRKQGGIASNASVLLRRLQNPLPTIRKPA